MSASTMTALNSCPLLRLPSELTIAIARCLQDPADVARLAASSRVLLEIARSDDIWRSRVETLVHMHVRNKNDLRKQHANAPKKDWKAREAVYAAYVQDTLSQAARYLGWWGTTQSYRGRLLRVSLRFRPTGELVVVGEEVSCINGFSTEIQVDPPLTEERWKPIAAMWHGHGQLSYRLPSNHPSPDAGFSVDIISPVLQYTPIFRFTKQDGFTLVSSMNGSVAPSVPISLPLKFAHRRKLNDSAGTSEQIPSRYSTEQGPSFPSRYAVKADILRTVDRWGQAAESSSQGSQLAVQGNYLAAPAFTLQARRAKSIPSAEVQPSGSSGFANGSNGNSMDYIYQERDEAPHPTPQHAPILLANPGGNQLFRAFLEGIGAVLPTAMQETLLSEDDEQEYFYPIKGPLQTDSRGESPLDKPVLASSLEGMWVGCYSSHGYEFGRIALRNVWTRTHSADEVPLEQIYDDEQEDGDSADPSIAREPLHGNLEGSIRKRRTILELIKLTGDVNVPAGQVSWVAILPSSNEQPSASTKSTLDQYLIGEPSEPDLSTFTVPTVRRSDWEAWSDLPPHTARMGSIGSGDSPQWDEGSVQAAGRIAFTGFIDTRFIDAQATFIREETGQVDEIRVKWFEMGKVSTFRRVRVE